MFLMCHLVSGRSSNSGALPLLTTDRDSLTTSLSTPPGWAGVTWPVDYIDHYEQPAAVEAARAFITQTPGKTFKIIIIPKLNFLLKQFIATTFSILIHAA